MYSGSSVSSGVGVRGCGNIECVCGGGGGEWSGCGRGSIECVCVVEGVLSVCVCVVEGALSVCVCGRGGKCVCVWGRGGIECVCGEGALSVCVCGEWLRVHWYIVKTVDRKALLHQKTHLLTLLNHTHLPSSAPENRFTRSSSIRILTRLNEFLRDALKRLRRRKPTFRSCKFRGSGVELSHHYGS